MGDDLSTPSQRLEWFIKQNYSSMSEVARIFRVTPQTLKKYIGEGGLEYKNRSMDEKLKTINMNPEWYHAGKGDPKIDIYHERHPANKISEPIRRYRYSGSNVENNNLSVPNDSKQYVKFVPPLANNAETYNFNINQEYLMQVDRDYGPDTHLAIKIVGNSMEPDMPHLATVIVDRTRKAMPGDFVLATVNNELFVRRYRQDNSGEFLEPSNSEHITLKFDMFTKIIGVVVEVFKRF